MNRRRHPRVAIDHPVVIRHAQAGRSDCRILNYSEGGLYLQVTEPELTGALGTGYLRDGQRPVLEILPGGFDRELEVEVVYVNPAGLGVAFLTPQPDLCDHLQRSARRDATQQVNPHATPTGLDRTTRGAIEHLGRQTTAYLEDRFGQFLANAKEALIAAADHGSKHLDQADLFFAIHAMEQQAGARLKQDCLARLATAFAAMTGTGSRTEETAEQGLAQTLQLVDKAEFDEWLILNGLTHRLNPRITRSAQKLELVLSRLLHRPITADANPGSPVSLLTCLQQTLSAEQIAAPVRPILYNAFSKAVFGDILRLYEGIHSYLAELGLDTAGADESDSALVTTGRGKYEPSRVVPGVAPARTAAADAEAAGGSESPLLEQGWAVFRQLEAMLHQDPGQPQARAETLPDRRRGDEELLTAVKQDELFRGPVGQLLERFEVPFIKAAVSDLALLEDPSQGGRRFLQVLQDLAPYFSTDQKSNRHHGNLTRELTQLFERLERGELNRISQVIEQLERIQQNHQALYERNRQLAIESFQRTEKLRRIYEMVRASLQQLLLGASISVVVDRLFRYGWANLLIQTAMLHSVRSAQWKAYLRVVEVLHRLFRSERTRRQLSNVQERDLLQLIRKGFSEYPVYPEGAERFVADLQRALNDPAAAQAYVDDRRQVDESYLSRLFVGQPGFEPEPASTPATEPHWLERVRRLEPGAWLVQQPREGESRMLNLACKQADTDRYLLIDGNGFKVMEANARQLARQFAETSLSEPRDRELAVVDRALQRILGKTYENIEQQASHDELTGLMNRRAFQRRLNESLHGEPGTHVLIMLDVDQFGLVNDLCGFDGGDKLLQSISHLLHNTLPLNALLARTGDDEFAILMLQSNLDQGFQVAETQRQSLDAFKYTWANQSIPVSASLGVVEIRGASQSSGELLKAAAAACNIAKQAGRNCTRVYRADDKAFVEHQQLIRSAASIEDALAQDRILLVAQAIAPLQDPRQASHYEILIRVQDEAGKLQGPFHFISAAEKYDLMRSVDRYVLNRFFGMAREQAEVFAQTGGFSINLSGQSVADPQFRAFLKQQITNSPLPRDRLGFEITETAMVKERQELIRFIQEVRAMGCSFYLDDFGSGYASFAYLKELPVDFVKIDGIFIRELLHDPTSLTMVKSVTEIAHFMQRRVVAEFVEDQATADVLKGVGVDFIQGYHIGRPLPLRELTASLPVPVIADSRRLHSQV